MQLTTTLTLLASAAIAQAGPWVAAYTGKDCRGTLVANSTAGVTCGTFPLCVPGVSDVPLGSIYLNPQTVSGEGTSTVQIHHEEGCVDTASIAYHAKGCHTPAKSFIEFVATCIPQ